MCRRAYNGARCSDRWVRYAGIEDLLTIDIQEVIKSCPRPALTSDAVRHRLRRVQVQLHTLRERRLSLTVDSICYINLGGS